MISAFDLLTYVGLASYGFRIVTCSTDQDTFDESLRLRPLPDGKLHTHFNFSLRSTVPTHPARLLSYDSNTNLRSSNVQLRETGLVPPSCSELIDHFGVAELGISLSRGRWDDKRWSDPRTNLSTRQPRGGQVWAWLDRSRSSSSSEKVLERMDDSDERESHQERGSWSGLTNTLAGLFCASLGQLSKSENVVRSTGSHSPYQHQTENRSMTDEEEGRMIDSDYDFFHGLLPLEQPCTENLTPILRLLPCKGHAGLAMLVNPHRVLEANWQSISISLRRGRNVIGETGIKLDIIIEAVLDPVRSDKARGGVGKRDWSLESVFDRSISRACPVARSSEIIVFDDPNAVVEPRATSDGLPIDGRHAFDLMNAVLPLELSMKWPSEPHMIYPTDYTSSLVSIERFWSGAGQAYGMLGVEIVNNANVSIEAIYIEQLPWWITLYVHTLSVTVNGIRRDDVVTEKVMTPSRARLRPYSLSISLHLLPQTRTKVMFEFEKSLLLYTEYASDANRGFDLPPAALVLRTEGSDHRSEYPDRLWTSAALIYLATPDFSMPYNVIIVTSTIMALFFGSIFNLLVREFKLVQLVPKKRDSVGIENQHEDPE